MSSILEPRNKELKVQIVRSFIAIAKSLRNPFQGLIVLLRICLYFSNEQTTKCQISAEICDILRQVVSERTVKIKIDSFAASLNADELHKFCEEFRDLDIALSFELQHNVQHCSTEPEPLRFFAMLQLPKPITFADCHLWVRQETFYRQAELNAFASVPSLVSSNAFVAEFYTNIIDGIVSRKANELQKALHETFVCVVEVGAGHASLSFQIARELQSKIYSSLVVATDFHDTLFVKLLELEWVQELCEKGLLDFAIAKAEVDDRTGRTSTNELILLYAQKHLSAIDRFDMVIFVANYAFDSFPVDIMVSHPNGRLFSVGYMPRDGSLTKKRYTYVCAERCINCLEEFQRIKQDVTCGCCRKGSFESSWTKVLRGTFEQHKGVHVVPVGAKGLLQKLRNLFPYLPSSRFSLLLGDCFLNETNQEWQLSMFSKLISTPDYDKSCTYALPSLHIPLLSPVEDAFAIPLTKEAITSTLNYLFSNENISSTKFYSPEIHSSFSVLVFSPISSEMPAKRYRAGTNSYSTLNDIVSAHRTHFGPSELVVLIQMLQEVNLCECGMFF
jgi:hypothetical protein